MTVLQGMSNKRERPSDMELIESDSKRRKLNDLNTSTMSNTPLTWESSLNNSMVNSNGTTEIF